MLNNRKLIANAKIQQGMSYSMNKMAVSIIITTYNAARYISETLESIKKQTFKNYEIILVDDGSTDNTLLVAHHFKNENSDIACLIFPIEHIGRAKALNHAIKMASHDWIAILDADDLWHREKLHLQMEYIKHYQLDFLAAKSQVFFDEQKIKEENDFPKEIHENHLIPISLTNMLYYNHISHSSVVIKKSLALYSTKRRSQIDYELFLRLLEQGVKFHVLDFCLSYHRIHAQQSFESKRTWRYALNSYLLQLKYSLAWFKVLPILFIVVNIGYHTLLPRKARLYVREKVLSTKRSIHSRNEA